MRLTFGACRQLETSCRYRYWTCSVTYMFGLVFSNYNQLGHRNPSLYDASTSEWADDESLPIENRLSIRRFYTNRRPTELRIKLLRRLSYSTEGPSISDRKVIDAPYVIAEHVAPSLRVAHLVPKLLDRLDITTGVVGMREVGRPEEAIAAAEIDHRGQ